MSIPQIKGCCLELYTSLSRNLRRRDIHLLLTMRYLLTFSLPKLKRFALPL